MHAQVEGRPRPHHARGAAVGQGGPPGMRSERWPAASRPRIRVRSRRRTDGRWEVAPYAAARRRGHHRHVLGVRRSYVDGSYTPPDDGRARKGQGGRGDPQGAASADEGGAGRPQSSGNHTPPIGYMPRGRIRATHQSKDADSARRGRVGGDGHAGAAAAFSMWIESTLLIYPAALTWGVGAGMQVCVGVFF